MKTTKLLLFGTLFLLLNSCNTYKKFPVSSVTPAADISAKKGIDNQKNFTLVIVAENLATAQRLNPPGNNYSVWIQTKNLGIKNVGQLNVENAKKTTFETTTAFDFYEVFITVENQGNLNYPQGKEIGRIKI
jgi:hypothetical protein